jgi:citrate lyase beta subunit
MVCDLLGDIETRLDLTPNTIKFQFLVESGWAIQNLRELVAACLPRLVGIIWGIADYSADIMLPEIRNDHPVCDWARAEIVNMAGAVDVPAIDNMTVNYPVADAALDQAANRARILDRLAECFTDARHGADLGMDGKWVGHPAQLFCVLLAYRTRLSAADVAEKLEIVAAYSDAVAAEQGATIIKGVMSDRATDRHIRNVLRRACAQGLLEPARALELGLISSAEAEQVVGV